MKKLKIALVAGISLVCVLVAAAFTNVHKDIPSGTAGYFYEYTSSSTAQADIQNISNYVRSTATCGGGTHVCGVFLPTNKPLGQNPVVSEFNAQKADLWDSEQSGSSVNPGVIEMKN